MRKPPVERDDEALGLNDPSVTRRDFVGGAILGTGAALLGMAAPGLLRASGAPLLGPEWTGPGGIGDYSRSNGNTHEVVNAAHSIWKGDWDKPPAGVIDAGTFDLVVVGGGFAGLMAAHTPAAGEPPDLRRRGQAERAADRRPSPDGAAGVERVFLAQSCPRLEGDRAAHPVRRAAVAAQGLGNGQAAADPGRQL